MASTGELEGLVNKKDDLSFEVLKRKALALGVKCEHCTNKECVILAIEDLIEYKLENSRSQGFSGPSM
ncbi:MAG: hypothetical protein ACNI25_10580 [Halarcobacter sp.]